jgi:hypothetical protein
MQYLLLIYGPESTEQPSDEDIAAEMEAYNAFTRHVAERGALKSGEALHPSSTATTVRVRDGQTLTTDGPFAETKEALGGVFLMDLPDLDEAIRLAALIPAAAETGAIEIRPVVQ